MQPSGFTQNVERTQRIVSGQYVILQSLGVITSHSAHDNALGRGGTAPEQLQELAGGDALVRQTVCWLPLVPAPARRGPAAEFPAAFGNQQIDVNLSGTANVIRVFAPLLVRRGGGRIIVTSSTQGQHGTKFGAAYSASKWGIIGLMKSAALELAAQNITVNAVIPGLVNTALTRHEDRYAQVIAEAGGTLSEDAAQDERTAIELLKKKTPLGVPWLEPEDVAPVVAFLDSDQAGMVSGTSFAVTGGDSAHVTA